MGGCPSCCVEGHGKKDTGAKGFAKVFQTQKTILIDGHAFTDPIVDYVIRKRNRTSCEVRALDMDFFDAASHVSPYQPEGNAVAGM